MPDLPLALAVIPARLASSRLPEKCLIPLCGKPMILWVVEAVNRCRNVDRVLVATDDTRIRDTVREAGWQAVMTRTDHPSGTDRVAEAACQGDADVIVNVQGDEPLIDPLLVDRLVEAMRAPEAWDMATAATPITDPEELARTSVVKTVWDRTHRALYFSREPIPHVRDAESFVAGMHWRHLGVYAYRRAFLDRMVQTPPSPLEMCEKLEQLRALHIGGRIAVIETEDRGAGVDTAADVARVERLLQERMGTS